MPTSQTTDEALPAVAELAEYPNFWTGPSGEQVTGEQVARHLEATAALLDKHGWVRGYDDTQDPELPTVDDDTATVKDMLRQLIRLVRELLSEDSRLTLNSALYRANNGRDGDGDTERAADRVLDSILRARTGARSASSYTWAGKVGRTYEEVAELIVTGAAFARRYGPRSTV